MNDCLSLFFGFFLKKIFFFKVCLFTMLISSMVVLPELSSISLTIVLLIIQIGDQLEL